MPFPIPKIEYRNVTRAGNTHSNTTVDGLASTSDLAAGMFVKGTGIPANTTIASVDSAAQITLSQAASSTASGVSLDFGFAIEFDYPPVEKSGEKRDSKEHVSDSQNGTRQVSVDFVEFKRSFKFSFVSQTIKLLVDTFMDTWGLYGKDFRYFDDKTLTSYTTYHLGTLKYDPQKMVPKGIEVYVWEFALEARRTV